MSQCVATRIKDFRQFSTTNGNSVRQGCDKEHFSAALVAGDRES
jgi:hypothetical protein